MTQSRRSFSVGNMFSPSSIVFTDHHSFVRIVESLQTHENSSSISSINLKSHPNKIHKLVRVVSKNKNEFIDENQELIDTLNENYNMNSADFSPESFPHMIGDCCAIYISFGVDNKINCNTKFFMSPSFKKRYIKYLLHEYETEHVDKFITQSI